MFEVTATIERDQLFPVKCGEIFLKSFADLTIYCSFCDLKLLSLEELLYHLQNNHFEHNSRKDNEILREYVKNKLLDEDTLSDEKQLESFQMAYELENESLGCDVEECVETKREEKNSNKWDYNMPEVDSLDADTDQEICEWEESLGADTYQENCVKEKCLDKKSEEEFYNWNKDESNNTTEELDWQMNEIIKRENNQEEYVETETNQIIQVFDSDINIDQESSENEDSNKLINLQYKEEDNTTKTFPNQTKKVSKKTLQYSCTECKQTFKLMMLLDDHILDNHGGHKCTICNKRFGKRHHLTRHESTHNTEIKYSCNIEGCGKTFAVLDYYQCHMRKHRYSGSTNTRRHRRYICDQCGVICATSFSLKVHMRLHTGEKPFKCDFCEKRYISKSSLKNHMVSHRSIRNFICNICQAAFKTNRALKKHHYIHADERNFRCELCGAAFKQPHGLLQHVQYVHKGKKDMRVRRKKN